MTKLRGPQDDGKNRTGREMRYSGVLIVSLICSCAFLSSCVTPEYAYAEPFDKRPQMPPKTLIIYDGQLPPPGQCRIWFPERFARQQPMPCCCDELAAKVPQGAWLVKRGLDNPRELRIYVYDKGKVIAVVLYDAITGQRISEEIFASPMPGPTGEAGCR